MNCSSAEAFFERFLDGELETTRRGAVAGHVDRCATCHAVLEELRVVDALLGKPRQIELAPNFTFATMAEARSLHAPVPLRLPIRAYLVSYLAAAWLIAGAALLLAPQLMHALAQTTLEIVRSVAAVLGGLAVVSARLFGRGGSALSAMLAALLALDALFVAGFGFALRYMRPRLVERLRS